MVTTNKQTDSWTCNVCTYENERSHLRCEMCEAHRPGKKCLVDLTADVGDDGRQEEYAKVQYASVESTRRRKKHAKHFLPNIKRRRIQYNTVGPTSTKSENSQDRNIDVDELQSSKCSLKLNLVRTGDDYNPNELKNKVETTLHDSIVVNGMQINPSNTSRTNQTQNDNVYLKRKVDVKMFKKISPLAHNELKTSIKNSPSEPGFNCLLNKSQELMKTIFSISSLRSLQPQAIRTALRRESQIIVMSTGGGKSLCYQLPACVLPGLTFVVSPLIALMIDQVQHLSAKGVEVACFSSATDSRLKNKVLERLLLGYTQQNQFAQNSKSLKPIKIFYCTPEFIETERIRTIMLKLYKQGSLALLAIDEAHCMSTWGHEFRPAYRKLSWLRKSFPDVPCMACTATATANVISDIRDLLDMNNGEKCHKGTFNRPNIHYEVRYKDLMGNDAAIKDLVNLIKKEHDAALEANVHCSGIVYVHKRQDTVLLSSKIREAGITAGPYHGGLKDSHRNEVQKQWTNGSIKVAVATVAFGMGIDLPHVRYVVHWCMSKSVEGFYQESGRGGRDGLSAKSVLYYSKDDASKFAFLIKKSSENKAIKMSGRKYFNCYARSFNALEHMKEYCTTLGCRRKLLLKHLGEKIDPKECKMSCDFCKSPKNIEKAIENTRIALIMREVNRKIPMKLKNTNSSDAQWDASYDEYGSGINNEIEDHVSHSFCDNPNVGINHHYDQIPRATINMNSNGFNNAEEILSHYEALECNTGTNNGFVKFKSKSSMLKGKYFKKKRDDGETPFKSTGVPRPAHIVKEINKLRANVNLPSNNTSFDRDGCKNINVCSSDQIKADLEKLKKEKEEVLAKLSRVRDDRKGTSPPPPRLSFSPSKKPYDSCRSF